MMRIQLSQIRLFRDVRRQNQLRAGFCVESDYFVESDWDDDWDTSPKVSRSPSSARSASKSNGLLIRIIVR